MFLPWAPGGTKLTKKKGKCNGREKLKSNV